MQIIIFLWAEFCDINKKHLEQRNILTPNIPAKKNYLMKLSYLYLPRLGLSLAYNCENSHACLKNVKGLTFLSKLTTSQKCVTSSYPKFIYLTVTLSDSSIMVDLTLIIL